MTSSVPSGVQGGFGGHHGASAFGSSAEAAAAVLELLERQLSDSAVWIVDFDEPVRALRIVDPRGGSLHPVDAEGRSGPREATDEAGPARADGAGDGYVEVPGEPDSGIGSFIGVPLVLSDGTRVGTLCAMARNGRSYEESDRRLLLRCASLVSYELERDRRERALRRLTDDLRAQATTDPLTGVANRRAFVEALDREWARRHRGATPSLVGVVDVDRLKEINDSLGHRTGDRVLLLVAQALSDVSRHSDWVARLGGDEFAVLLVGSAGAASGAAYEWRVRNRLRELAEGESVRIELSFGFHPLDECPSAEAALEAADRAMYERRRARRRKHPVPTRG